MNKDYTLFTRSNKKKKHIRNCIHKNETKRETTTKERKKKKKKKRKKKEKKKEIRGK